MLNLLMPPVLTGLYTFILGILITFFGIVIIVVFVSLSGTIFNKINQGKTNEVKKENKIENQSNEIPDEIKVAIIASISTYYFTENKNNKCDFIVKNIKRI